MKKLVISSILSSFLVIGLTACGSSSNKNTNLDNTSSVKNSGSKKDDSLGETSSNTQNENIQSVELTDIAKGIEIPNYKIVDISGDSSDDFMIKDGAIYARNTISNGEYLLTVSAKDNATREVASAKLKLIINDDSLDNSSNNNSSTTDNNQNNNQNNQNQNNNNNQNSSSTLTISSFTKIAENDSTGDSSRLTQAQAKAECESRGMRLPTFAELNSVLNVNNIAQIADFDSDGDSTKEPNSFTSVIWSSEPNTGLWFEYHSDTKTIIPRKYEDASDADAFYYTCVPK